MSGAFCDRRPSVNFPYAPFATEALRRCNWTLPSTLRCSRWQSANLRSTPPSSQPSKTCPCGRSNQTYFKAVADLRVLPPTSRSVPGGPGPPAPKPQAGAALNLLVPCYDAIYDSLVGTRRFERVTS
jgi:hypothetical protein